jgi:hypothetical protein
MPTESFHEKNEYLRTPDTLGMIMIKPIATQSFLDVNIESTMCGDLSTIFSNGQCEEFIPDLDRVHTIGRYHRDLSRLDYGEDVVNLFYGDKQGRRYFPMIQESYTGPVSFVLFDYSGDYDELYDFMMRFKGEAGTYDEDGGILDKARGIRGVLTPPHRFYSREESTHLPQDVYEKAFAPVVNNFTIYKISLNLVVHFTQDWSYYES